ncbi:hypothetical protein CVT26_007184 [Gymnopilus dilepis]|uniref:Uncharacterized protein n=1 Tax=Gymnopilus dilepis TaxID=231916 RepID=A0A409W081_9AGAR|nr:hypothetical protein CVT26_007184 [Gymnopilus dilepis]
MQTFHYQVVPLHLFAAPRNEQMPQAPPKPRQFHGFNRAFRNHVMKEEVGEATVLVPRVVKRGRQGDKRAVKRAARRHTDL